jgi:hypothetical protein
MASGKIDLQISGVLELSIKNYFLEAFFGFLGSFFFG